MQDSTGRIWILETKGGQSSGGESQNIDQASSQKFVYLMQYIRNTKTASYNGKTYSLGGGFVRFDNGTQTLLINTTTYEKILTTQKFG